jgi:hypothetical protein
MSKRGQHLGRKSIFIDFSPSRAEFYLQVMMSTASKILHSPFSREAQYSSLFCALSKIYPQENHLFSLFPIKNVRVFGVQSLVLYHCFMQRSHLAN